MITITYIDSNNITHKKQYDDNIVEIDLSDKDIIEITGLDKLVNLQKIDLSDNIITKIKNINNLVNLQILNLSDNMITEIKNIDNLVNLQELYLSGNKITEITGLDNLVNLQELDLCYNRITEIKNIDNLVNLQELDLSYNKITEITGLDNLVNLQELYLAENKITQITGLDNKYNLQDLDLSENKITVIPLTILNNINLTYFSHDIHIVNPIITRFLNRNKIKKNKFAVYNDNQNVHNSDINKSISQSIYAILNTREKNNEYMNNILCDPILTTETKESFVEYCACNDVHSTLNVTFAEVLHSVWCIIQKHADSIEIKRILNTEMSESICKCFTGRLSRLINTLNGFDDRVCIMISNNDAIGNIIVMTIAKNKDKNIIEQKEICKLELLSRGYTKDIIDEWIDYI